MDNCEIVRFFVSQAESHLRETSKWQKKQKYSETRNKEKLGKLENKRSRARGKQDNRSASVTTMGKLQVSS